MEFLYNIHSKEVLEQMLEREPFTRKTLSFYRYFRISDPPAYRDMLYQQWAANHCLGRIYVAGEGINAQMSVPEPNIAQFLEELNQAEGLNEMPIKWAVEDDSRSFLKLVVRVRDKIVADGLPDDAYDVSNVGNHLTPEQFHYFSELDDSVVLDMRNDYEFEIGHFKGALNLGSDTFREALYAAMDRLKGQEDKKILLYCTGGIRCEKASAWLRHHGFNDVNQLHGGIIEYAKYVRANQVPSNFTGKNFVFDNRLGESIDGNVISYCQQCGQPCDDYTNCANDHCHVLFIQCRECAEKLEGCCSGHCHSVLQMSDEEKATYSQEYLSGMQDTAFNNSRIRRRNFERFSCST